MTRGLVSKETVLLYQWGSGNKYLILSVEYHRKEIQELIHVSCAVSLSK